VWDKLFLPRDNATKKLLSLISNYDLVVGIADHNKNATQNRFDPKYVNKWGKKILIEGDEEFLVSNLTIVATEDLYKYSSITNGPCNRSAYLVMSEILKSDLKTKFGFFHLRKSITSEEFVGLLSSISR
jgi:hypothetical protein